MFRPLLIAAMIALPAVSEAQQQSARAPAAAEQAETANPPQRIRSVTLGAGQKCPANTDTEIVVCSTLDQPYRIPKQFRGSGPIPAQNQSWVNRTATVDQVGRVAGGLPDTCSPVGTGGQSGCSLATNKAWAADRRARQNEASQLP